MSHPSSVRIAAVVLAAGRSRRMGQPKMILPWGDTTVIGQVVRTLAQAGLDEIVVVTGGARRQVEQALSGCPARTVYNPRYAEDQMALSLQVGLASLPAEFDAALVALGDQPQMRLKVVHDVVRAYQQTRAPLVFPSYRMRRGHPWIISRLLWPLLLALPDSQAMSSQPAPQRTLRDLLAPYADQICYVEVEDDSILRDLDTPADYRMERPAGGSAPAPENL
jgi:molybdenum cofactor cytidylyltransferase